MATKFKLYEGKNSLFVNPYNFLPVAFDRIPVREEQEEITPKHTGVLHCELITKTPLAIPETEKVIQPNPNSEHKEYDFMRSRDGRMMIPGSSIRGPVRSMYEALTNSCFLTTDGDEGITYRTKDAFQAGLICKQEDGGWKLFRARRFIFVVDGDGYKRFDSERQVLHIKKDELDAYRYGQPVWFIPLYDKSGTREKVYKKNNYEVGVFIEKLETEKKAGFKEGYMCVGEPFSRKHFESVFYKLEEIEMDEDGRNTLQESVRKLDVIIRLYNDDTVNANAKKGGHFYGGRNYKKAKDGEMLPVWYKIKEGRVYLSVAEMGRSAYIRKMGDMLGTHRACTDRSNACPACRLFGMTGKGSRGSRVRFTDAFTREAVAKTIRVPLKELAGPKPSYMPFYVQNTKDGAPSAWSYDSEHVSLRGRKYYWHNLEKDAYREAGGRKGERSQSMELAGEDHEERFVFSVYYDNITEEELSGLIWTLTLGENQDDGRNCHKIGHGKSIGLGSSKIVIKKQTERRFDDFGYQLYEYSQSDISAVPADSFDKSTLSAVKIIVRLDASKLPVMYPGVVNAQGVRYTNDGKNNHASHQWFGFNYKLGSTPKKALPTIFEVEQEVKALQWITEEIADDNWHPRSSVLPQLEGEESSGVFTYFNREKGFGFVKVKGEEDVFVHYSKIVSYNSNMDYKGKKVYIEFRKGRRGYEAIKCVVSE